MLAVRLDPDLEARLDAVAKRMGRSKSHLAREALNEWIEEMAAAYFSQPPLLVNSGCSTNSSAENFLRGRSGKSKTESSTALCCNRTQFSDRE